jgi:hypothetical protein
MLTTSVAEEHNHLRTFEGFLREPRPERPTTRSGSGLYPISIPWRIEPTESRNDNPGMREETFDRLIRLGLRAAVAVTAAVVAARGTRVIATASDVHTQAPSPSI